MRTNVGVFDWSKHHKHVCTIEFGKKLKHKKIKIKKYIVFQIEKAERTNVYCGFLDCSAAWNERFESG